MIAQLARIMRGKEVCARTGLDISHIYKLMSENRFPQNFKIARRAVGWDAADVERWIEGRIQSAKAGQKRGPGRPLKNPWLSVV